MLHQKSFAELRELYSTGSLLVTDVVNSAISHANAVNNKINAFALIDSDYALLLAKQSQQRWQKNKPISAIDGMPVSVKEFANVQGWPTRRASVVTSDANATENTAFVQRLIDAGAIIIGKTRASEFNWKGVTDSPGYGITRNPWNLSLTPGGSSGGCSAAVAAGVVRVSIGSDAGGSVRIPASFTGTLALKPTHGFVPIAPVPTMFSGIVHTGPIGVDAQELIDVMEIISGFSPSDSSTNLGQGFSLPKDSDLSEIKIGIIKDSHWSDSSQEVKKGMELAIDYIRKLCSISVIDFDVKQASIPGKYFYKVGCDAVVKNIDKALHDKLDPGLLDFINSVENTDVSEYLSMCALREKHSSELAKIFESVDVLMLPTLPITAFKAGINTPDNYFSNDWMDWNPYTPAFNSAQLPAISFPVWVDGFDMPVGVQFVANKFNDGMLLQLAKAMQKNIPIKFKEQFL